MYENPPLPSAQAVPESIDVLRLARALRFALGVIVLGFAAYSIQANFSMRNYAQIFKDMLGEGPGSELPPLTVFVLAAQTPLLLLSAATPIVCVAQMFSRKVIPSIYILGIAGLVMMVQTALLYFAVALPFMEIMRRLNGGPAGA
jgi:hypothetical protein